MNIEVFDFDEATIGKSQKDFLGSTKITVAQIRTFMADRDAKTANGISQRSILSWIRDALIIEIKQRARIKRRVD